MATAGARRGGRGGGRQFGDPGLAPLPEDLRLAVEKLGLTPYEAKVLLGLLRLGTATIPQLADVCGVPRAAMYATLDELATKRLAERLPNQRPMLWATRGRDAVLTQLHVLAQERLHEHRARTEEVREMLAQGFPEAPAVALPYVHIVRSAAQVQRVYDQMLRDATTEILMFTRPPYVSNRVNQAVLDVCARGVTFRVLYEKQGLDDPGVQPWMDAYDHAGVQARVVDDLPIKLVVVDRAVTLMGLRDPIHPDEGYPTTLHVEHPGYALTQAWTFEHAWAHGQRYVRPTSPAPAATQT